MIFTLAALKCNTIFKAFKVDDRGIAVFDFALFLHFQFGKVFLNPLQFSIHFFLTDGSFGNFIS